MMGPRRSADRVEKDLESRNIVPLTTEIDARSAQAIGRRQQEKGNNYVEQTPPLKFVKLLRLKGHSQSKSVSLKKISKEFDR